MNRVWLITGANSGFGRAIAEAAVAAEGLALRRDRAAQQHGRPAVLCRVRRLQRHQVRTRGDVGSPGRGGAPASPQIGDYTATVGPTRQMTQAGDGTQPGDPAKAATAILTALDAEHTPLRLPLGDDAVDAILGHLDAVRAEITAWEMTTRDTRLAG